MPHKHEDDEKNYQNSQGVSFFFFTKDDMSKYVRIFLESHRNMPRKKEEYLLMVMIDVSECACM